MNLAKKVNKIAATMIVGAGLIGGCAHQKPVIVYRETGGPLMEVEMQRRVDHDSIDNYFKAYEIPLIEMIDKEYKRLGIEDFTPQNNVLLKMDANNDGRVTLSEQRRYFRNAYGNK